MGSSPLARGLRYLLPAKHSGVRIIPARAGFTEVGVEHGHRLEDHPRSRGVYADLSWDGEPMVGSSPLARGLRGFHAVGGKNFGIIPARAGFTG